MTFLDGIQEFLDQALKVLSQPRPAEHAMFENAGYFTTDLYARAGRNDIFLALSPGGEDSTAVRNFIESNPVLRTHDNVRSYEDLYSVDQSINNSIQYLDQQNPKAGKWQSPSETLETGQGDCEDSAVLKFHVLKDMGVPEKDMRIVLYPHHVALAVRMDDQVFVMENNPAIPVLPYPEHQRQFGAQTGAPYLSIASDHKLRIIDQLHSAGNPKDNNENVPDMGSSRPLQAPAP